MQASRAFAGRSGRVCTGPARAAKPPSMHRNAPPAPTLIKESLVTPKRYQSMCKRSGTRSLPKGREAESTESRAELFRKGAPSRSVRHVIKTDCTIKGDGISSSSSKQPLLICTHSYKGTRRVFRLQLDTEKLYYMMHLRESVCRSFQACRLAESGKRKINSQLQNTHHMQKTQPNKRRS